MRYKCITFFVLGEQAGLDGLEIAIERFDLSRNTRLSTFAHFWVHTHVRRRSLHLQNLVHIPEKVLEKRTSVRRAAHHFIQQNGRSVKHQQVSQFLGALDLVLALLRIYSGLAALYCIFLASGIELFVVFRLFTHVSACFCHIFRQDCGPMKIGCMVW